ncbi:MAG: hypothetical protein RLZZ248_780 [Bacteroidota bacterium]|jgi:hypothetical protein
MVQNYSFEFLSLVNFSKIINQLKQSGLISIDLLSIK